MKLLSETLDIILSTPILSLFDATSSLNYRQPFYQGKREMVTLEVPANTALIRFEVIQTD